MKVISLYFDQIIKLGIYLVACFGVKIPLLQNFYLLKKCPAFVRKIFAICFAHILVLIEEIYVVYDFYLRGKDIQQLTKKNNLYKDLSSNEKSVVKAYFAAKKTQLDGAQKIICRESSIQLVLQNTLIVYQAF